MKGNRWLPRRMRTAEENAALAAAPKPRAPFVAPGFTDLVELGALVRDAFALDHAAAFAGSYHLHIGGKTGETMLAAASLPAIRRVLPHASIVWHLHPHYRALVEGLAPWPDAVICDPWYTDKWPAAPLGRQVTEGLRWAHAWVQAGGGRGFVVEGNAGSPGARGAELHTSLYRTHTVRPALPFYRMFARAAGVEGCDLVRPEWIGRPTIAGKLAATFGPIALVFVVGNTHTGGANRIDLEPEQWEALAKRCRGMGIEPCATGHKDDAPPPEMPGWTWITPDDPSGVLEILTLAERVIGLNSGITFAAALLSPGIVTMLDTQEGRPEYLFAPMVADGILEPRHVQIPWSAAKDRMFDVLHEALLPF